MLPRRSCLGGTLAPGKAPTSRPPPAPESAAASADAFVAMLTVMVLVATGVLELCRITWDRG